MAKTKYFISQTLDNQDQEIKKLSKVPFKSVPLFLPSNVKYDSKTNQISSSEEMMSDDFGDEDSIREELVLVPGAGLDLLRSIDKPISCIACIGPYRTGKSFLLSRFLNDSKAFELGSTLEGCTRGIWISTSAIVRQNENGQKYYTLLLDCEGAGDPLEGDDASNARIALVCILLSSVFIFNNVGRPDRSSLQFLSYLETIRQRIPTKTLNSTPEFFPSFVWVFRDFFLQMPIRKKTGKAYTLKEYMLERVLTKPQSSKRSSATGNDEQIVDCLLSNFQSFDVVSVRQPQKKDGEEAFTSEEMSELNDIEWGNFHDEFRLEVDQVLSLCLSKTSTFKLGCNGSGKRSSAKGSDFVLWCQQVKELVNSEEILPDIPDMQQQLLRSIADKSLEEAIDVYNKKMTDFLDTCPVFNLKEKDDVQKKIRNEFALNGIAGEEELASYSDQNTVDGINLLQSNISSQNLLEEYTEMFREEVFLIYTKFIEENEKRSKIACDKYARYLYQTLKDNVRENPTGITIDDFEEKANLIESLFTTCARGPCVNETLKVYLNEQKEADRSFLKQVHNLDSLYQKSLKEQESLNLEIQEKQSMLSEMEIKFQASKESHVVEIEKMTKETEESMKKLENDHSRVIEETIKQHKEMEELHVLTVKKEMEGKLTEAETKRMTEISAMKVDLESFKAEAQNRLVEEVSLREEQLKKEDLAHKEEMERLLKLADDNIKKEILAGEEKRKIERTSLQEEMNNALKLAEDKLNDQLRKMEEEIKKKEEKHKSDIERTERELKEKLEKDRLKAEEARKMEQSAYEAKIDELEKRCFGLCIIM